MNCSKREWVLFGDGGAFSLQVLKHTLVGFLGIVIEDSSIRS